MRVTILALTVAFLSGSGFARNFYIPVAGSLPGKGDTYFRTDVRIFNPSPVKDITVTIHFLPQGSDNANMPGQLFRVNHRQMLVLDDVVDSLYGWDPPLLGALRIDSNDDVDNNVIVHSRTYAVTPSSTDGTKGQFIPATDVTAAMKKSIVMHVAGSSAYRTNAVIMNPQRTTASVTVSLAFADGALVAPAVSVSVPPMSMVQFYVPEKFATTRTFDEAFLHFDADLPVITGASVIDNHSSDPFFVPGIEDKDEVLPIQ